MLLVRHVFSAITVLASLGWVLMSGLIVLSLCSSAKKPMPKKESK